jgi:hypothetical protein
MIHIIILFIFFILFFYNLYSENFTYFNLNLDITNPKSYNNINNNYYDINFHNKIKTSGINNYTDDINNDIFNNRIKLQNINTLSTNLINSNNCCLIQKRFNSGNFNYMYTKLKDSDCNNELYELDQNNQLLYDGINNWSNDNCNKDTSILGSCRIANLECIDFITKEECFNITSEGKSDNMLKFNMSNQNNNPIRKTIWSNKTCQDKIF